MLLQMVQLIAIVGAILGGIGWIVHYLKEMTDKIDSRLLKLEQKLEDKVSDTLCKLRREQFLCAGKPGSCTIKDLTDAISKLNLKL